MTSAGRAVLFLLAASGALLSYLAAVVPGSAVTLTLQALIRQQRAPRCSIGPGSLTATGSPTTSSNQSWQ
jgi:hypothetical protein